MISPMLVAFASRRGSTEEVGTAIADKLRVGGHAVEMKPAQEVVSLDAYGSVVLGAPLYDGAWHADAHAFLIRHQAALSQRPIAIFTLGPLVPGENAIKNSRMQLDMQLKRHAWLKTKAIGVFGGRYDPAQLTFLERMLNGQTPKDVRDWDAIHAWAQSLPALFISI